MFALNAISCLTVQPLFFAFVKNHSPRETMRIPMLLGLVMERVEHLELRWTGKHAL